MSAELVIEYYREFRTALFISGFTLGAFLFSMKAVIVKIMKEDYYDLAVYQDEIANPRSTGASDGFYTPLKNFSNLLIWAIAISFSSAILQISLGFFANILTVSICLFFAVLSWTLVGF